MNAELVATLRARGVIAADAPPPPDAADRPWFIALLMGLAGWFAGFFVIVFLAIALDPYKADEALITGLALLAVAWVLYFIGRERVFVDQLALALSIAGQLAVALFLVNKLDRPLPISAAILGMQLAVFAAMPDRTARTLATFFASIAWVFVVRLWLRPHEGDDFFDSDGNIAAPLLGGWTLPVELLLTWLPSIALIAWLRRTETRWMARGAATFARPALTGLLLGLALGGITAEPASMLVLGMDEIGRRFDWWGLFPIASIALAMIAAWNAFALRSAGLLGVAIVAALIHVARFYYVYGTTLTTKAVIMLGAGAVLLGAGRLLGRRAGALP